MSAGNEFHVGDAFAGRYLIESKLGESPAAKTYVANENHSAQKLVLKIYGPQVSARLLEEPDFFLKSAVLSTLQHDGLAQVFEVTEGEGLVAVAREYVEGDTFETFAQANDGQGHAYAQGMQLLWQVAQALTFLHENHRHLRVHPRNLILGSLGAKLVDADPRALPLSDLVPESLPMRPEFRGYFAPETRTKGFVAYPNTDLFGLAGLLFRLVTGEHPGEDARTLYPTLQRLSLAREIEDFLVKAMHPKPEDRFGTAEAFSEALWNLQPYLERMQGQTRRSPSARSSGSTGPATPPAQAMPLLAPDPDPVITPFQQPASKSPAFQAADPFSSSLEAPPREPTLFGSADPFGTTSKGSDTLFGTPAPKKSTTDFFTKPEPQKPKTEFGMPPQTGSQGTDLFASPPPPPPQRAATPKPTPSPFHAPQPPARPAYQPPPPPPPPPVAKMSSLESDASDLTLSGSDTGMTQFGFKGASSGDRTGEYRQEVVRRKRKLTLIIGIVSALGVVVLLVALYFVLRATAPQPKVAPTDALSETAPLAQGEGPSGGDPLATASGSTDAPTSAGTGAAEAPPFPESQAQPSYEDALSEPAQPANSAPNPPKPSASLPPVQAPKLSNPPSTPTAPAPVAAAAATSASDDHASGSSKVSPERRAEIEAAFKARQFPPTARERLKMADDFNDMGRLAEANMVYRKTLEVAGVSSREKTLAFGGMAVTFKNMGMKPDARAAVDSLLVLNPKNRFAQGLKAELQ